MKICVVSNDAGGAEILSSWSKIRKEKILFVLTGPAKKIFRSKIGKIRMYSLKEGVEKSDYVVCGSSGSDTLEREAIFLSKKLGKKVICALEHWTSYIDRFYYKKKIVLPDEIWVFDRYAKDLALNQFKGIKILMKKNLYFQDIKKKFDRIKKKNKTKIKKSKTVLFVSDRIKKNDIYLIDGKKISYGYDIVESLKYFLNNIHLIDSNIGEVKIRLHPSEKKSDWNFKWIKENNLISELSHGKSLAEELVSSDIVVGCDSMAMVVGLLVKKRVVSVVPPGGRKCSLPHRKIEHLQNLIKNE